MSNKKDNKVAKSTNYTKSKSSGRKMTQIKMATNICKPESRVSVNWLEKSKSWQWTMGKNKKQAKPYFNQMERLRNGREEEEGGWVFA